MPDPAELPRPPREWTPPDAEIDLRRLHADERTSLIVRHPWAPYVLDLATDELSEDLLRKFATLYLFELDNRVKDVLGEGLALPAGWKESLDSDERDDFEPWMRWRAIWPTLSGDGAGGSDEPPPRLASWNVRHGSGDRGKNRDVVMVGSELVPIVNQVTLGYGLRVPVAIRPGGTQGGSMLVIRSLTADILRPPYRSFTEVLKLIADKAEAADDSLDIFKKNLGELENALLDGLEGIAARNQVASELSFEDLLARWADEADETVLAGADIIVRSRGVPLTGAEAETYRLLLRMARRDGDFQIVKSRKRALTSHATPPGRAEVFHQDPSSWTPPPVAGPALPPHERRWSGRRPTGTEANLHRYRVRRQIGNAPDVPLEVAHRFRIRKCPRYVRRDRAGPPGDTKSVRLPPGIWPNVRRDDFSAISAFYNCGRFFRMIDGFGIAHDELWVQARDELQVFYRSGMNRGPGRDGQTINARVSLMEPPEGEAGLPTIEMHLALANLTHRARPQGWAEPLGIAASPRWVWHEFGHVLIAAKFGELEFPFVHSVGDALAAVMADPYSRLADATDETGLRYRGYTYPWVFATRRHDRSVRLGWAWDGSLNQSLLAAPMEQRLEFKGYITEQILSSTLFRLYRILGGDSVRADGTPDHALRKRASLLVQFLVIQTIRMLAHLPDRAEDFEEAMQNAERDITSLDLGPLSQSDAPYPDADTPDIWRGGRGIKVVRWAFEAQGMFGPTGGLYHNAPGLSPDIDIYIPDHRPERERTGGGMIDHGRGAYVPVSLDWDGAALWQATAELARDGGQLRIVVGNRGQSPANGLRLRFWTGTFVNPPGGAGWDLQDQIEWIGPSPVIDLGGPIQPGQEVLFTDVAAVDDADLLLVEVSCPGDAANSDPAAVLPCAVTGSPPTVPRYLADLVANDNNLGLRRL